MRGIKELANCSSSVTGIGQVTPSCEDAHAKRGFPWRKAVRGFISVGLVVAIFVFAIPKFASDSQMWPILKGLSAAQIVWLALAQFLNSAMASVLPAGGAFARRPGYRRCRVHRRDGARRSPVQRGRRG